MALDPAGWSRFSHDPLQPSALRASDADRAAACDLLGQAYADGLIDADEHGERMERATSLRQISEIAPLLEDIMPRPGALSRKPDAEASLERLRDSEMQDIPLTPEAIDRAARRHATSTQFRGLLWTFTIPVGVCLAVWTLTSVVSGHLIYFWPAWVILGTGIGAVGVLSGRSAMISARKRVLTTRARAALGDAEARGAMAARPGAYELDGDSSRELRREHRRRRHGHEQGHDGC